MVRLLKMGAFNKEIRCSCGAIMRGTVDKPKTGNKRKVKGFGENQLLLISETLELELFECPECHKREIVVHRTRK